MVAVLAMGCAAGLPLERSVELANVAAGEVCAKLGTAVLAPSELLAAFRVHSQAVAPEKWLSGRELVARVGAQLREDGRRIVFANGCFDVLHAGHVALLQAARAFGDVLVVGLNTDESVQRLKGPTRPVSGLDDRVAVISALAAVDVVCAFDEDTPLELILALRPDVLVKGGDYAPEDVVGGAEAAAWGGRVEIVPLLSGRSTTRLLQGSRARP
jgi:D-beta-D-heptose 7-phosphate kinase/D-beta-D-heptose 1-phosphate adenosyltransferase